MADRPESLDPATLTSLQPGLARLMPEIAARMWKAFYAAQGGNWDLSRWQLKEMQKLFRLGNITRPKYAADVESYLVDDIAPLMEAVDEHDFAKFQSLHKEAVDAANEFHRRWQKPWIMWQLPATPPLDLVLQPTIEPKEQA